MDRQEKREIRVVSDYIAAINARDLKAVERIVGPECKLIDSKGGWIEGHADCVEASRRFFALAIDYRLEPESVTARGGDVLVRGKMRASDPILAHDCLWRARSNGSQLTEWQSFARGTALPVAQLLMPETARFGYATSE